MGETEQIRAQLELNEMMRNVKEFVKSYSGLRVTGSMYWENENLRPNYSSIISGTQTKFYLKQAKNNDSLSNIQTYNGPLAITVNAKYKGLRGKKHKFRVWNLSKISFLSKNGSAAEARNFTEYEMWSKHSRSTGASEHVLNKFKSLDG